MNEQLTQFAKDSNAIEGEIVTTKGQIDAVETVYFQKEELDLKDILALHSLCGRHLKADWVGRFRDCQVYIGDHLPPAPEHVQDQMETFVRQLPMMDSWKAHNLFEAIHPFQDLNGRVGRLIWLSKAVGEGYDFQRSFLHHYYYQTLNHSQL